MTIAAAPRVTYHSNMAKQKSHKKQTKKGYNGSDLQASPAAHSPTRNLPRRRRRNMNMLSADDYKLRQKIEHGGKLTIIDMESDGNCLFRSISDQLYYDYGNNHHEIRHEICNYIEDHKDDFIFFLVLDDKDAAENDEDASDFESYVSNMRHDGDWGGQIELLAASRVYRRNITVYSTKLGKVTIEHESPKGSSGPDLLLSYHDNEHYNSIRVSSITKPPPPIKYYVSPYNRTPPMDLNDENQNSRESDSEMVTEDKNSTTTTTTISRVSTPDVEMSETDSNGQTISCTDREIVRNEGLPPVKSENDPDNLNHICPKKNYQCSQNESVFNESKNQNEVMTPPVAETSVENQIGNGCSSLIVRHERCNEAIDQSLNASYVVPAVNKDTIMNHDQIPQIRPNTNNHQATDSSNNDQNSNTQRNDDVQTKSDQIVVANEVQTIDCSDQPSMDGTFRVLQI